MQRACGLWQYMPHVLWISSVDLTVHSSSFCIPASKARTILGLEFHLVVFDAWSGLDVNALAAVSGTIRAGGALVLLTPQLTEWAQHPDPDCRRFLPHPWQPEQVVGHFIDRFVTMLRSAESDSVADGGSDLLLVEPENIPTVPISWTVRTTMDQQQSLMSILAAENPAVLSADRGRGKSAVLGMAARQLHDDGLNVVLTAPARAAVSSAFQHAEYAVSFYAPDDLLQSEPEADLLLVDEAAAIPLPMLMQMLQQYPRCVFATTLQGYEGSGRGFLLRFLHELGRLYPEWLDVKLQQPIRWSEDDQLERFINRWLIMDSADVDPGKILSVLPLEDRELRKSKDLITYQQISQSTLANNELKLREVFQLLLNAHYQTRPSDLRQIVDAPHITLHVLEWQQHVVAVVLLAQEGKLELELTAAIHAGKRRPHGHLLPQSLTFHSGISGAACLSCERIMRIAVAPAWQRQGLGHLLLAKLRDYARQKGADYLGVSYAMSPELSAFWQNMGFKSARLGYRKDKASGRRSLMQVLGLSARGIALMQQANRQFLADYIPGQNMANKKIPNASR